VKQLTTSGDGQNNGNTKKLRNRIYVGYIETTSVGSTECSSVFFTFCSDRVSALMIVLNEGPCERIEGWEACPILKEDRLLVRV
jgi:hypothetical protein